MSTNSLYIELSIITDPNSTKYDRIYLGRAKQIHIKLRSATAKGKIRVAKKIDATPLQWEPTLYNDEIGKFYIELNEENDLTKGKIQVAKKIDATQLQWEPTLYNDEIGKVYLEFTSPIVKGDINISEEKGNYIHRIDPDTGTDFTKLFCKIFVPFPIEPCPDGQTWDLILGKCVPNPEVPCPTGQHWDETLQKCVPDGGPEVPCPTGQHWDETLQKCVPDGGPEVPCPTGQHWDETLQKCVPDGGPEVPCPTGQHWDETLQKCVPDGGPEVPCPTGQHWDETLQKCVPDGPCPPGQHLENGVCVPDDTTGEIDSNGIKWLVAKGAGTGIEMSRDQETDDRWSGNVKGLLNGFEATMIAKSINIGSGGHFAMKQFGGNHSGSGASSQRWYDTGLRSNGDIQLEWEGPHPDNHDFTLPDSKWFKKKISKGLDGNWIGLKWCCQKIKPDGSPADGGVRVRMWVDEDPLDANNKPKNNWQLVFDFIDGVDAQVINPQSYKAPDEQDCEVRRSDTESHDIYSNGQIVRAEEGVVGLYVRKI